MDEEIIVKIRQTLLEKIGVQMYTIEKYTKNERDFFLKNYMTSFIQRSLDYYKNKRSSENRSLKSVIKALRSQGISYKLSVPPLTINFTYNELEFSIVEQRYWRRLYIGQTECVVPEWNVALIKLLDPICQEYKSISKAEYLEEFVDSYRILQEKERIMRQMIRNSILRIINSMELKIPFECCGVSLEPNERIELTFYSRYSPEKVVSFRCLPKNIPAYVEKAYERLLHYVEHSNTGENRKSSP